MSIEDDVRAVRQRASQRAQERTRAEIELANAEERLADAKRDLKEEFGVATSAEAKALRDTLQAELEAAQEDIEAALAEAGA